jgi:hypothetical protein
LPKITAIELKNFQTIGARVVIPIRDLTLMFGPNGAGKSAIFDALDLLRLVLSDEWGEDCKKLNELLSKWSRKIDGDQPTNCLGIGIQIFMDDHWGTDDWPGEIYTRLDQIYFNGVSTRGDYAEDFLQRTVKFFIEFKTHEEQFGWYISELTISSGENIILELLQDMPENYPIASLYKQEWISFSNIPITPANENVQNNGLVITGRVRTRLGFAATGRGWFERRWEGDEKIDSEFRRLLQQVIDFFKMLIVAEMADTPLVKASRIVPRVRDAISLIPGEKSFGENNLDRGFRLHWSPLLETLEPIVNDTDYHWTYMCKLVAQSMTSNEDEIGIDWSKLNYLARINGLLREELFIENGYQLKGEVFCAVRLTDFDEYIDHDNKYHPKFVRLYLVDNYQRELDIEDVGSGIGYVLPVLASLVHDDISLIQQPELHLHPRLQSQLGEAIVKSVENKKDYRAFTLIETHSEHVLLRVMRLIRQSESRKNDSKNPLTYDRVSVLYFEPLPSGETQVKRLRLAPDGQLIDRWPGGFFNERFTDIFDA